MDELIRHACNGWRNETVQRLAMVNERRRKGQEEELGGKEHLQIAPDGIARNRARFSARSVAALTARYFAYIQGHLWRLYFLVAVTHLSYGSVLRQVFPTADIAGVSGCYDPEDDFNNTCTKSAEDIANDLLLEDNLRYTFLAQLVYLLLVAFCAAISFNSIFRYFLLEHRNGMFLIALFFTLNNLIFSGWYSSGVFILVNSAYEIVFISVVNVFYVLLIDIYSPVLGPSTYWSLLFLFNVTVLAYQGVAQCVTLLAGEQSLTMQNNLLICTTVMQILLANSFIPLKRIHYIFRLASNFSVIRLLHENVILLLYGFGRCRRRQVHAFLYNMEVEDEDYGHNVIMLLGNLLLFRSISTYLLMSRVNPVEHSRPAAKKVQGYVQALKARRLSLFPE